MRHPRRRSAAAVALAGLLPAACGGPAHHAVPRAQAGLTGDPHGVVVLQGRTLTVLDRLPGLGYRTVTGSPSAETHASASTGQGAPDAASSAAGTSAATVNGTPASADAVPDPTAIGAPAAADAVTAPAPAGTAAPALLLAATAGRTPAPESTGVQPLSSLRQLSATLVAGLRGQTLVALDPRHPAGLRPVAPALAWFPDRAGTGGWAVTAPNQPATGPGACPRLPHSRAPEPRYRLEHRDLATGAVERAPFLLPCGVLPVADTPAGLVTETVRRGAGSAAHPVLDVRLADRATLRPGRYLARSAVVLDAGGSTLLVASSPCAAARCVRVVGTGRARPTVGTLPGHGRLAGAGALDPTGRYLAAAAVPSGGGAPRLVVDDLRTGSVKDLGPYRTPGSAPPSDVRTDMPCVWSGTRFLYADPSAGTLSSYDTAGGRTLRRSGLETGRTLQVWGAAA